MPFLLTISGFSLVLIGAVIFAADRLGRLRIKVRVALPHGASHSGSLSIPSAAGTPVPRPTAQMSLFAQDLQAEPTSTLATSTLAPLPESVPFAPIHFEPVRLEPAPLPASPAETIPEPVMETAGSSPDLAPDPRRRSHSHTSERLDWAYFNKDLGDLQDPGTPRIQPAPAPRLQLRRPPRSA